MLQNGNAFNEVSDFISASLNQIGGIKKPCKGFFKTLLHVWLMLPVRYTMYNISRYSRYCDKSIRRQLGKKFPFFSWMRELLWSQCLKECIVVFDPTYISKSGKKTYGLARFWSGTDQRVKKGLEAGCLALVDVAEETAYHLEAIQTPAHAAGSLVDHYAQIITSRIEHLKSWSRYIVVDGYFMKKNFILPIVNKGMHVITKMRQDANLKYLYTGTQKTGRGRKRKIDGKVSLQPIDKRRWKKIYDNHALQGYELTCWCVTLKRSVKVVYLQHKKSGGYELLLSTDIAQAATQIIQYYRLRFQIEFLIRDAKQHTGLEHCQGRSEEKLYNHFNMALSSVTVAKKLFWEAENQKQNIPFSMRTIKTWCYHQYLTAFIFSNLDLDLNCKKIRQLFQQCISIGGMAA